MGENSTFDDCIATSNICMRIITLTGSMTGKMLFSMSGAFENCPLIIIPQQRGTGRCFFDACFLMPPVAVLHIYDKLHMQEGKNDALSIWKESGFQHVDLGCHSSTIGISDICRNSPDALAAYCHQRVLDCHFVHAMDMVWNVLCFHGKPCFAEDGSFH
jgi:hypothetical protein